MTLYRYMSAEEAIALFLDKQTLTNTTDHHADHHLSTTSQASHTSQPSHYPTHSYPNPDKATFHTQYRAAAPHRQTTHLRRPTSACVTPYI